MNYSNNAYSVTVGDISSGATAISVASGTGSRFPASDFRVTLIGYDVLGNESAWEICHCTSRSGDVLTVTRGQEGTTAIGWGGGSRIENRVTAGVMASIDVATGTTSQYWRGDKSWRDFFTDVRAATLTGLSTATNAVISAADTVLGALGKLQKQITDVDSAKYDKTGGSISGDLSLSGNGRRITGDFSNATVGNRLMLQSTTTNSSTMVEAIPNGAPAAGTTGGAFAVSENSDPANGAVGQLYLSRGTALVLASTSRGTGSNLPIRLMTAGVTRVELDISGRMQVTGPQDGNIVAMAALDVDCSTGNYFTKTIAGNSTFTFSNPPASRAFGFVLKLVHTSGTVTWPASVVWDEGTAPTLTTGKTHRFVFTTDNGGTTWAGSVRKNYTS